MEDFDLKSALQAESTTPREKRKKCPHCGSIDLNPRNEQNTPINTKGGDYLCVRCDTALDKNEVTL